MVFPSLIVAQKTWMSLSRSPLYPLLNISSALASSAFTAATAFISIALASSAVPPACSAKVADENMRSAADAAAIVNVANLGFFLVGLYVARDLRTHVGPNQFRNAIARALTCSVGHQIAD